MKVAVVGLGYWGPNLVRNLAGLNACKELIVCDRDEARVSSVLRAYPLASGATDYEELLEDPELAAVVLATPVATHTRLAERAIEAGKSVLVEKPFAVSADEARRTVELAAARGVLAMAGHTFLYSPPVRKVRAMVSAGMIGTPLYLQSSRVNLGIHQSDVSVLWDLAPHDVSILLDWLDEPPVRVSAAGRSSVAGRPPDVAFVDIEFASGFMANLHLSWLAPTKLRRMTLVGSQKMIVYEDTNPEEPVKVYDKGINTIDPENFGEYGLTYRTGDVVSPRIEAREPLRLELDCFLERVAKGELPDEREEMAVQVVKVIEAAEQSLLAGGFPVDL